VPRFATAKFREPDVNFFASCPPGVADLLARELSVFGATATRETKFGVNFQGELETAYRACLWSRLASRVLMPLATFPANSQAELYAGTSAIDWSKHLAPGGTLAIDFAGASSGLTHTHFGALRTKDAIVDQLRARFGERPSIDLEQPNIRIDVRVDRDRATVSLDLSGDSLHRRGYRARGVAAPLKENLAAAILLRCGWPELAAQGSALVDPLCGSGTFLIEGALMMRDIAPGLLRKYFGFLGWRGHDAPLWQRLVSEAEQRARRDVSGAPILRGYDRDSTAVHAALENVEQARLRGAIHIERRELTDLKREFDGPGLLVTNPPYGERIGDQEQLKSLYDLLGQKMRDEFVSWKAAVLTGNPPLARELHIEAKRSHTLFNGRIECRLLRFDLTPENFKLRSERMPNAERREMVAQQPGAQMFANRLRKNLATMNGWAEREGVYCYRVYDADMPEYSFAIDLYGDGESVRCAYLQEYEAPRTVAIDAAKARRAEVLAVVPQVLGLGEDRIFVRTRRRQKGTDQYEKVASEREFVTVREGDYRFLVNFNDYLDTGLFLDHRMTRAMLAKLAPGKRFLNLFAYTGTATVYAAGAGASASTTVDMSRTYLDWAKRNLALNQLAAPQHGFVQEDCLEWLANEAQAGKRKFDLVFVDPPTHSRSKRMTDDFDVQRDHAALLDSVAKLLTPDGLIVFSNNYTRFKLDDACAQRFEVKDESAATLPRDFARNPRIHRCYVLRPHSKTA
jgi:23S rRNA (guanine2445-N2)-methyltransferase / 23S rRNA (guanine2069-N7)-methyltransferase